MDDANCFPDYVRSRKLDRERKAEGTSLNWLAAGNLVLKMLHPTAAASPPLLLKVLHSVLAQLVHALTGERKKPSLLM